MHGQSVFSILVSLCGIAIAHERSERSTVDVTTLGSYHFSTKLKQENYIKLHK